MNHRGSLESEPPFFVSCADVRRVQAKPATEFITVCGNELHGSTRDSMPLGYLDCERQLRHHHFIGTHQILETHQLKQEQF
jgi:hypothetical protein